MKSTRKHKKHADLVRPDLGEFGRLELALIGAPCNVIQETAQTLIDHLSDRWNIAYVDADHQADDVSDEPVSAALFNSFEKGDKQKGKNAARELEAKGVSLLNDTVLSLQEALMNEDDAAIFELTDGISKQEKRAIWDMLSPECQDKMANRAKANAAA